MIDFTEVYDRFEGIRRTLIGVENKMLNDGAKLSATEHSVFLKLLRMAESEAQGILATILRMRGTSGTVRRHGQDAAISWSAGIDPANGQVALTTTDVFTNVSETFMMDPEQFLRLVEYFTAVTQQIKPKEVRPSDY